MTALACAHVYHDRCLQAVCEAKALNSFWAVTCPLCRHCAQPEGTAEIASDRETVLPPILDQYKNDLETLFFGDSPEEIPTGQPSQDSITLRQSRSGSASSSGIVRNDSGQAVDIPCKTLHALYAMEDSAIADGADRGKGKSNAKGNAKSKAKSKAIARKAQKVPEEEPGEPEGGGDELAEDDEKKDADDHKLIAAGKSTSKGIGKVKAAGKEQASKSTRKAKATKPEEKPEDDGDDHAEEEEKEEDDREGDNEEGERDDHENEVDDDETPVASTSPSKRIGKTGKGQSNW